jgi:hypothetical protein
MKRMTGDAYLLIGIMAGTLAFGLVALSYPSIKTKLVPAAVSGIAFVLAGIQLGIELSKRKRSDNKAIANAEGKADAIEDEFSESAAAWRENLIVFGWLVGFMAAIYLVGFIISTLLLVFLYLKLKDFGWMKSSVTAVLAAVTIYVVFIVLLRADLFPGIIIEAFLS